VEPEDVLRAFWTAMCAWERRAWQSFKTARQVDLNVAALSAERAAIIGEHCTPKPRVYSGPLSCGDPPQYDPDTEDVLEVVQETARRVAIHTQQRVGFKNRRKFIMLKQGDRWLLDNWQVLLGSKWSRGII
jgi:hypothetical protein